MVTYFDTIKCTDDGHHWKSGMVIKMNKATIVLDTICEAWAEGGLEDG